MKPGEFILTKEEINLNVKGTKLTIRVKNTGDRPIQVGSHYHFSETNSYLSFDRKKALGFRLNVPAGSSVRFEPGQEKDVELTSFLPILPLHPLRPGSFSSENYLQLSPNDWIECRKYLAALYNCSRIVCAFNYFTNLRSVLGETDHKCD